MNESKKTLYFIGIAAVLALVAFLVTPSRIVPEEFMDQGQPFYPNFTDPNIATTLEIIDFDQETGEAHPFKVTFDGKRWIIPSHHDYPADAKDQLAQTAAGIIQLRKDDFRSDNISDQEACGVIDPLDDTYEGSEGRGQRVTLKDKDGNVLADLIFGKNVEGSPGYRFVRVPDKKRVYAVKTNVKISSNFTDWINTDLLEANKNKIDRLTLLDYSIDERTQRLNQKDQIRLYKDGGKWKARKTTQGHSVDSSKIDNMLNTLDQLQIVGVRPKPEGLSASLKQSLDNAQLSREDMLSLQSKGYFFTRDGDLKSNEGELLAETDEGIVYTLRFGEVFYGSGLAVSAGTDQGGGNKEGAAENRYLFITTSFDADRFPEPPKATNMDFAGKPDSTLTPEQVEQKSIQQKHDRWQQKIADGQKKSADLNARFAGWYYVIPADSFDKLHLNRSQLMVKNSA